VDHPWHMFGTLNDISWGLNHNFCYCMHVWNLKLLK
jgi:hypothetical protein